MILTDKIVKTEFKFGASIVDEEDEDAIPLRGKLEPNHDNPEELLDLWITDGANTVITREAEPVDDHYRIQHNGKPFILVALREKGWI